MTTEVRLGTGSIKEWTLPPGWEAVQSEKDNRVYYWNKKTGATTWKFPDKEAKEHDNMVRKHTYENMRSSNMGSPVPSPLQSKHATPPLQSKPTGTHSVADRRSKEMVSIETGSTPTGMQGGSTTPTITATGNGGVSSLSRGGYENVQVIQGPSSQTYIPKPLPRTQVAGTNPQPCPLPSYREVVEILPQPPVRSHSFAGLSLVNHTPVNPTPLAPQHNTLEMEWPSDVTTPTGIHQVSTPVGKYDVEHHYQQDQETSNVGQGGTVRATPPTVPLRAFQRMSCREMSSRHRSDGSASAGSGGSAAEGNQLQASSMNASSNIAGAATFYDDSPTYSTLDQIGQADVDRVTVSPYPYEMTSSCTDPTYAEIKRVEQQQDPAEAIGEGDDYGYSRVRLHPRGHSSPLGTALPATGDEGQDHFPLDAISSSGSICSSDMGYDLPSNSLKLKSVDSARDETGASPSGLASPHLNYAKLGFTKEACMLRSGVSLKRNQRESLCSFSRTEAEEERGSQGRTVRPDGSGSSGEEEERKKEEEISEETMEPTNKNPNETTLACSGTDFEMVIPSSQCPSWITYERRPHAYEDIMGASQEDIDWDESDDCLPKQTKMRVLHHQYEEIALGQSSEGERPENYLPQGWVFMKDEKQPRDYYWHIPSGKTQFTHPNSSSGKDNKAVELPSEQDSLMPPSYKAQPFPANYLGCLPVEEQELMPGQCVKVVHACISRMTSMLTSTEQIKAHKEVLLAVKGLELQWLHPQGHAPITVQPINRIRVWGIGLDDNRDFGYVSRDPTSRKHLCHVFRCSLPARAVAHLLLESHQHGRHPTHYAGSKHSTPTGTKELGAGAGHRQSLQEHYERITCTYIGSCDVNSSQGMETLNEAVDRLSKNRGLWQEVTVDVVTSSVTICDKGGRVLGDHRVRFLSFLGIARDDKFCGYILDSGEVNGEHLYRFHGFTKEPNADKLCLVLHNACQARYRRAMRSQVMRDTAMQDKQNLSGGDQYRSKPSSVSLFGRLGSLKKSKLSSPSSPSSPLSPSSSPVPEPPAAEEEKRFTVQYLGHMPVSKMAGLDIVKPVVQDLASSPSARENQIVEFTANPSGLSFVNSRTNSSPPSPLRKEFPVRNITYVVKIRNSFAFVAREGNRHVCHAFMESKVDAGTIVNTIQHMLAPAPASQ